MKIHADIEQGSSEWHALRALNFTASELGPFALAPVRVNLTVEQIRIELDKQGIAHKSKMTRPELIGLIPNPERFEELCEGARTAIIKKIVQNRPKDAWQVEMDDKAERMFEYLIPTQRGNALEPQAREWYAQHTGYDVVQVGFIEHDSGGFGCSPDGLIYLDNGDGGSPNWPEWGVEIKCPMPENHLAWLLAGVLPDEHKLQVHAGMAVTGLDRWDFLSFCPGDAPLLLTIERDDYTDRLEEGLKRLVAEKVKMKAKLSALWQAAHKKNESEVMP